MGMNFWTKEISVMAVTVVQGNPIANSINPNNAQHAAAKRAIELLTYADLWGVRAPYTQIHHMYR